MMPTNVRLQVPDKPYRGIRPFRFIDRSIFFARKDAIRKLMGLISIYRAILLYGDSGSGKSSVVNAGLIHEAINEGFSPERLRVQPRAGEEIVVERISLNPNGGPPYLPTIFSGEINACDQVVFSIDEFKHRLTELKVETYPLLIFDQFEELITLFEKRDLQRRQGLILNGLVTLILDHSLPVKLILVFREDYLAKLSKLLAACSNLCSQKLRLTSPSLAALPEIIRGPFKENPGHFKVELSERLANKLRGDFEKRSESGDLNLTEAQICCEQLCESDEPEALFDKKGVQGLLEDYLSHALNQFDDDMKDCAVALLSHLVTSAGTRNVVSKDDLIAWVHVEDVIDRHLVEKALDTLEQTTKLVRRENRPNIEVYEISSEFLVPWITQQKEQRLAEREQRQRKRAENQLERERKSKKLLGSVIGILTAFIGLVSYLFMVGVESYRTSLSHGLTANAMAQLPMDPELSVLLATKANHIQRTSDSEEILRQGVSLLTTFPYKVFRSNKGEIHFAAFTPDGQGLLTLGPGDTPKVWDANTGKPKSVLQLASQAQEAEAGENVSLARMTFSQNGKYVLLINNVNELSIWNMETGQRVPSSQDVTSVSAASFSEDTNFLATVSFNSPPQLWKMGPRLTPLSKPEGLNGPNHGILSLTFSPDGKRFATTGEDGLVYLWDTQTGKMLLRHIVKQNGPVYNSVFSPEGNLLATLAADGTILVWNSESVGTPVKVIKEYVGEGWSISAKFSPAPGRFLITYGAHPIVRVWDLKRGNKDPVVLFTGHTDFINSAEFSQDGKFVVTASADGTAQVWEVKTGKRIAILSGHTGLVMHASFNADGNQVATASTDGTARIWNLQSTQRSYHHDHWVNRANFSRNGKLFITGSEDGTAKIWQVGESQPRMILPGHKTGVSAVDMSPDGRWAVTGTHDGMVRVWDIGGSVPGKKDSITSIANDNQVSAPITSVAFSADGHHLAIADVSGKVRLFAIDHWPWELKDTLWHNHAVTSVGFGKGEWLVTASVDKTVALWSLSGDRRKLTRTLPHPSYVQHASLSSDGKWLATASTDKIVRIWNVSTGKIDRELRGHTRIVNTVAFNPLNAEFVLTAADDKTARVWARSSGRTVTILHHHSDLVTSAVYSPDGSSILTSSRDGTAAVAQCELCGASLDEVITRARSLVSRELTPDEQDKYLSSSANRWAYYLYGLFVPADEHRREGVVAHVG